MRARFALLASIVVLLSAAAFADSQARIVRLSYLEGNVQLDRGDGNGYLRAFLNMPLIEGASVWTAADARAEIEFEDGSTARLAPNTIVVFTELRLRGDGSKLSSLTLSDGVAYFSVKRDRDDQFRVFAGGRELALEKTSSFRVVHSARQDPFDLRVAVFKGELRFVQPDGQRIALKKNETLTLDLGEPDNRYFLARGIVEEAHDYWNRERDEDRVILAQKQRNAYYVSDLDRYGSYIQVAGYGQLWRPFGVSIGWDPFGFGSWVYYPRFGYIWVSNYVWGWTPYRYGSWLYVNSYGWCWRPSRSYHYWNPHPVIVNAPGGYVVPVAPPRNAGPVVRVGRRLEPEGGIIRDGRTLRDPDGPVLDDGAIQDRIRGVRTADTRFPRSGRSGEPVVDTRTPDAAGPATGQPTGSIGGRPTRSGRITDNAKPAGSDQPSLTPGPDRTTPQGSGTPMSPAVGERPSRPTRFETPDSPVIQDRAPRPTRVETAPPLQAVPPSAPVVSDRPSRPSRSDSPSPASPVIQDWPSRPSRIDTPQPRPQARPSSPPPQRMSPPPQRMSPPPQRMSPPPQRMSPPPQRMSPPPQRMSPPPSAPSRPSRTTIKDH